MAAGSEAEENRRSALKHPKSARSLFGSRLQCSPLLINSTHPFHPCTCWSSQTHYFMQDGLQLVRFFYSQFAGKDIETKAD